jgi:hypothetical protein
MEVCEMNRKRIFATNIPNVMVLAIMFSILFGALTEDLMWFLGTVGSLPIISILLYVVWWKYGHNGIRLNSINCFIMMLMFTFYTYVPLLSLAWGTWLAWGSFAMYILIFIVSYITRENIMRKVNQIDENGGYKKSSFIIVYGLIMLVFGIFGFLMVRTVSGLDGQIEISIFFYLFSYLFVILSPLFLITPEKALNMKAISQEYYDEYR